jgi:hypothetical protein
MRSEKLYRSKLRLVSGAFYFWLISVYQELASKNRLGYDYLTTKPKGLLASGQKSWAKRLEPKR